VPAPVFSSIEMIRKLIAFDTTSRDSNLALIDFVRGYLAEYGIESELFHDDERRKANLYATLGPKDRGGVMLSGHTDVVPVDGQEWSSNPFEVTERNGKLYGRGTSDMKSFVAIALAMVPEFLKRDLKTPIHLALSYDEEVGCVGVRSMINAVAKRPVKPAFCIVGEPSLMKPVIAHKGKISVACHVRGLESHSALTHLGVNAVEAAAEIIAYLKGMARRKRDHGPFDRNFAPPFTTIHTGVVNGGTALNIVPKDCSFIFEFRTLPGDPPEPLFEEVKRFAKTLLPEMRSPEAGTGIVFEELTSTPGLSAEPDSEVARLACALSGANEAGKVSFGTEAGLFEEAGIPTVVCGPGSIDVAHKPDEFIEIDQVRQCEAFLRRLLERVAA
jgi:acetylornithine deacetylase